jgi:hypothetical protein
VAKTKMRQKISKLSLSLTLLFLILAGVFAFSAGAQAAAEKHYVTQNGAGAKNGTSLANSWSVADFNTAANWNSAANTDDNKIGPGDSVYFSGTITTKPMVPGSGTVNNHIIIDGYENGDCQPLVAECTNAVNFMDGFALAGNAKYITVQDSRSTDQTGDINYDQALSVWHSEAGERNEGLIP